MGKVKPKGNLREFHVSCVLSELHEGVYELKWQIVADNQVFSQRDHFPQDHFNSLISYVIDKSYRKLKYFLTVEE